MKILQSIGLFIIACLIGGLLGWWLPQLYGKIMYTLEKK